MKRSLLSCVLFLSTLLFIYCLNVSCAVPGSDPLIDGAHHVINNFPVIDEWDSPLPDFSEFCYNMRTSSLLSFRSWLLGYSNRSHFTRSQLNEWNNAYRQLQHKPHFPQYLYYYVEDPNTVLHIIDSTIRRRRD